MKRKTILFFFDINKMDSPKLFFVFTIPLFILMLPGCEMNSHAGKRIFFRDALLYNEYIVARQKELIGDIDVYNMASQHNYIFAIKTLDSILLHTSQSLLDIQNMAPYKNDSSFREVSADFFKYYADRFVKDNKKLILIKMKMDSGKAVSADYKDLQELDKKISSQSESVQARLEEIQGRFARRNNFQLSGRVNDDEQLKN